MWLVSGGGDLRSVCAAAANHASPLSAATTPRPSLLRQPRLAPLCCASRRRGAFPAALRQRLQAWQAARECCRCCKCCRHECASRMRGVPSAVAAVAGVADTRVAGVAGVAAPSFAAQRFSRKKKACAVCAASKTHITELNSAGCTGNCCRFSRFRGLDALLRVS